MLPQGRLRESRSGAIRADILVVTKCRDFSNETASEFESKLQRYSGPKPVFFSGVEYKAPLAIEGEKKIDKNIVLVTGIGNSKSIVDYVSSHFDLIRHFQFNDHHQYSIEDINSIQRKANSGTSILTTEKDLVKLISPFWLMSNCSNWL